MSLPQQILFVFSVSLIWACQLSLVTEIPLGSYTAFIEELGELLLIPAAVSIFAGTLFYLLSILRPGPKTERLNLALSYSFSVVPLAGLTLLTLSPSFLESPESFWNFSGLCLAISLLAAAVLSILIPINLGNKLGSSLQEIFSKAFPYFFLAVALVIFFHPIFFFGEVISSNGFLYIWQPFARFFLSTQHGYNPVMSDFTDALFPQYYATYQSFWTGEWPLTLSLNTNNTNNATLMASSLYSFDFGLILLFGPVWGWTVAVLSRYFLGGIFTYLLLREFKLQRLSSLFGAVTFSYSCFAVVNTLLPYAFAVPILFYISELFIRTKRPLFFYFLIFANLLTIFAGQIVWTIHIFTLQGLYILFRLYSEKESNTTRLKILVGFALAGVFSLLLISFLILPSFEHKDFLSLSYREGRGGWFNPMKLSLMFLYPAISGSLLVKLKWGANVVENAFYAGILPLALVGATLFFRLQARAYFFLLATILVYLITTNAFWILELVKYLPFYGSSANTRLRFLWGFLIPVTAAFVFDRCLSNKARNTTIFSPVAISLILVLGLLNLFTIYDTKPYIIEYSNKLISAHLLSQTLLIFASLGLLIVFASAKNKVFLGVLLILFTFAELKFQLGSYLKYLPPDKVIPKLEVTDYLKSNQTDGSRILPIERSMLANTNYLFGLNTVQPRGFYTPRQRKFFQMLEPSALKTHPTMAFFEWENIRYDSPLLDLLNVKYLANIPNQGANELRARVSSSWKPVLNAELEIYENKDGFAPAFLVQDTKLIQGENEIYKVLQEIDPTTQVILEDKNWPRNFSKKLEKRELNLLTSSHSSYVFKTTTDAEAFLLFSQFYHPAWKAFVNNKPVNLTRANYVFMGLNLPRGTNQVELRFEPQGFRLGLWISSLTALVLLLAIPFLMRSSKK